MKLRRLFKLGVISFIFVSAVPAGAQKDNAFQHSEIVIESKSGNHKFKVEIARTQKQLALGLMFRRSLSPNEGMLFDYKRPQNVGMWMKNTLIPLDMLFIDASGRIINIHERAVPGSLESIPSRKPVLGVLELNGGTVSRFGVSLGDKVRHPIFGD